jgi:DNA-binding transcriptional regulator YiaG
MSKTALENKTVFEKYTYKGLGFDIELQNVEMKLFAGEYHPIIDVANVSKQAMQTLISQQADFTGNQIKFVRTFFQMDQAAFAKLVHVQPDDVKKWEATENKLVKLESKVENELKKQMHKVLLLEAKAAEKDNTKFQSQFFTDDSKKPDAPRTENTSSKKPKR